MRLIVHEIALPASSSPSTSSKHLQHCSDAIGVTVKMKRVYACVTERAVDLCGAGALCRETAAPPDPRQVAVAGLERGSAAPLALKFRCGEPGQRRLWSYQAVLRAAVCCLPAGKQAVAVCDATSVQDDLVQQR